MVTMVVAVIIPLIVISVSICLAETNNESGRYNIQLDQLKACNATSTNDVVYNITREYQDGDKKRPCFTGKITLNRDVNDELTTKVHVEMMEGETWKDFMDITFKKGCSETNKFEPSWFEMMNAMNFNLTDCPIPKGVYTFNCARFPGQELHSQMTLKYGRYRAYKSFWDKDVMIGCHYAEAIVAPA